MARDVKETQAEPQDVGLRCDYGNPGRATYDFRTVIADFAKPSQSGHFEGCKQGIDEQVTAAIGFPRRDVGRGA
jgi:hypothetical protein